MGTFGVYTGAKKIRPEKAEEFSHSVSKILYYGGMMHLEEVKMYDIKLTLLEPVRIEAEQDTSFRYNYFEDDVLEWVNRYCIMEFDRDELAAMIGMMANRELRKSLLGF